MVKTICMEKELTNELLFPIEYTVKTLCIEIKCDVKNILSCLSFYNLISEYGKLKTFAVC